MIAATLYVLFAGTYRQHTLCLCWHTKDVIGLLSYSNECRSSAQFLELAGSDVRAR